MGRDREIRKAGRTRPSRPFLHHSRRYWPRDKATAGTKPIAPLSWASPGKESVWERGNAANSLPACRAEESSKWFILPSPYDPSQAHPAGRTQSGPGYGAGPRDLGHWIPFVEALRLTFAAKALSQFGSNMPGAFPFSKHSCMLTPARWDHQLFTAGYSRSSSPLDSPDMIASRVCETQHTGEQKRAHIRRQATTHPGHKTGTRIWA
jgi:hypothetical protein